MGNVNIFQRRTSEYEERTRNTDNIPEISVIEASPKPAEDSVFQLPGPVNSSRTGQEPGTSDGLSPTDTLELQQSPPSLRQRQSQHRPTQPGPHSAEDEERLETASLTGSDGSHTPIGSREHFLQVMMDSSPQVRRSLVHRRSFQLSSKGDSDSISQVSYNLDEDRTAITLEPLEHEWMMCASDGNWDSLQRLLREEPSFVTRKDFITGFTCLHWAAKYGNPDLMALIINFAKQHNVPVSVDVQSNAGYTPLHLAAMHNHMEVVKLLVGAYDADVEVRDFSGRKANHYITDSSSDIRDIIGTYEQTNSDRSGSCRDRGHWRFSKPLLPNVKNLRLLNPGNWDSASVDGRNGEKIRRRTSSLRLMNLGLQRLRSRTSQIIHNTELGFD